MICTASGSVLGSQSYVVNIEITLRQGLPSFDLVGLPGQSLKESRTRVQAAIRSSGFRFPLTRLTVNMGPAQRPKDGAAFDLALALGVLAASGEIPSTEWPSALLGGELSLDGTLRAIPDGVAIAALAYQLGRPVLLPEEQRSQIEALGLQAYYAETLRDAANWAIQAKELQPCGRSQPKIETREEPNLHPIFGQDTAKRALQIAGAGRHHLLLIGSPGVGKSLLAENMIHYLPSLSAEELLAVNTVYASSHTLEKANTLRTRPVRQPHHGLGRRALFGSHQTVGEVTLANHGVLILNDLPLYPKEILQQLCDVIDRRNVVVRRGRENISLPAGFVLAATANPCPCGFRGHPKRTCICLGSQLSYYRQRLLGPLLDRFDMVVFAHPAATPNRETHPCHPRRGKASANGWMDPATVQAWTLDRGAEALIDRAMENLQLTMRGREKTLRVAKTIAELDQKTTIEQAHLAEALQYRYEVLQLV